MTTRTALLHCARVYLAQSRHFTSRHRGWSFVLLAWAANKPTLGKREANATPLEFRDELLRLAMMAHNL